MSRTPLVLGVDGGGTKTLGLVSDELGNVLARREVGPSNPTVVGFERASKNLFDLIASCSEDVHCTPEELQTVVLALAGAGRKENQRRIHEGVGDLFLKSGMKPPPLIVDTDARAALEGAFGGASGVIVIAGTGSVVCGKTDRNEIVTIGGWGRVVGDEGSGFHIGREALRALTMHLEGRGEAQVLAQMLATRFNLTGREEIIAAVYHEKFDIASVAPLVLEAAAQNDLVSQKILQRAAALLAEQVRVIVLRMGILRKVGLVFCGGLIDHETVYANVLHMKILKVLPQVDIRPPLHPPAYGAVLMAIERVKTT